MIPCEECIVLASCRPKIKVHCCILFNYLIENHYLKETHDDVGRISKKGMRKVWKYLPNFESVYKMNKPRFLNDTNDTM